MYKNNLKDILHNKRKLIPLIIGVAVIGILVSPLPGIEAITMSIVTAATDVAAGEDAHDLTITVLKDIDDTPICAGDCSVSLPLDAETIGMDKIIQVVIDEGTSNENVCDFDPQGTFLGGINCVGVAGLELESVIDTGDSSLQGFGTGYQYFYGRAFDSITGYFGQLLGDGSEVYGLTAYKRSDGTDFLDDVEANYKILIAPGGLTTGTHTVTTFIVDEDPVFGGTVLKDSGGPQTFLNTGLVPGTAFPITGDTVGLNFGSIPSSVFSGMSIEFPADVPAGTTMSVSAGSAQADGSASRANLLVIGTALSINVVTPDGSNPCGTTGCGITVTVPAASIPTGGFDEMELYHVSNSGLARIITNAETAVPPGHESFNTDGIAGDDVFQLSGTAPSFSTIGGATSSGGGGASTGGGGGGGGGGGAPAGIGGQPTIYTISYDVCEANMVTITAGPNSASLGAMIRTPTSGTTTAKLVDEQPYANKLVFAAPISPNETFFTVQVDNLIGRDAVSAKKSVNITGCTGTIVVTEDGAEQVKPKLDGATTFTFRYNGITFEVDYKFDGQITDATVDEDSMSVAFSLANVVGGDALISLPTALIDAANDEFILLADGESIDYTVEEKSGGYTVLSFDMPAGTADLTVIGTSVVPEFGVIAMAILAVAIISIVAVTRFQRFPLVK